MRIEELSPELVEKAKGCETTEERMAFIQENGIELTEEQLQSISGGRSNPGGNGRPKCPNSPKRGGHNWVRTGNTRPGSIFGDLWPDKEERCTYCGETQWVN